VISFCVVSGGFLALASSAAATFSTSFCFLVKSDSLAFSAFCALFSLAICSGVF